MAPPRELPNYAGVLIGVPGAGKSTLGNFLAARMARSMYVVAHDPTHSYRCALVRRHPDAESVRRALGSRPLGIHVLDIPDGLAVLSLARSVAESASERGQSTLLVLDEAVACSDMSPSYLHPEMKEAYLTRRHIGLCFLLGTQAPQNYHPQILQFATHLYIFRTPEDLIPRLRRTGLPAEACRLATTLPDHEFLIYRPGALTVARHAPIPIR